MFLKWDSAKNFFTYNGYVIGLSCWSFSMASLSEGLFKISLDF